MISRALSATLMVKSAGLRNNEVCLTVLSTLKPSFYGKRAADGLIREVAAAGGILATHVDSLDHSATLRELR